MPRAVLLTLIAMLVAVLPGAHADAGAWMREPGDVFLSFTSSVAPTDDPVDPVRIDPTLYAEYGVNPRLTIGLDGYLADNMREGEGFVFARIPVAPNHLADPVAVIAALGLRASQTESPEPLLRVGASWGRGLSRGWLAADALATYATRADGIDTKLDLTAGWNVTDRLSAILQVQTGQSSRGDPYAKVAPSAVWRLRDGLRVEFGLVAPLTYDAPVSLKLGTWFEY